MPKAAALRLLLAASLVASTVGLAVSSVAQAAPPDTSVATTSVSCESIGVRAEGVECGRLSVRADWFDPSNPAMGSIAYAIHRATGRRIGTLTYNPGGPGVSGLDTLPIFLGQDALRPWQGLPPAMLRHFDVVAWDARGVGASTPALRGCPRINLTYGDLPDTGPVDWLAATQAYSNSLEASLSACYAANTDVAGLLGTAYVVRDLEALRVALGVSQWTYWGMS